MKKLIPLLLLAVIFTAGCDLAGISITTTTQTPLINSFVADPPTISAGQSSTLSWSVTGARTVSIDQGIGNVSLTGNRAVMPNATTVYTLTATNAAGVSVTATAQVIVSGAITPTPTPTPTPGNLPVINYFTANPSAISVGGSTTLSWNVSNATSVNIQPGVGTVGSTGTISLSPLSTTTYTLMAINAAGSKTTTTQVVVSGIPSPYPPTGLPVVNYFTANPPIISAGGSTTLSWNVSNATAVKIDPGIGPVSSVGSTLVSPATSTNYTLTASNTAGLYYMTIAVMVTGAPPVVTGWTGTWSTNWGKLVLIQSGNQVTGNYEWENGHIVGMVSGNFLSGTWSEAPSYNPPNDAGDIEWTMSPDGNSFTGHWRYGSSGGWSGSWSGTKIF